MIRLIGTFSVLVECDATAKDAHYSVTSEQDGTIYDLAPVSRLEDYREWVGQRVLLTGELSEDGTTVENWQVAHPVGPRISPEERMKLRKHVKVALVRIVPEWSTSDPDAPHERAEQMQDYWNAATQREYRFEVKAWVIRLIEGESMPNKGQWCLPTLERLRQTDASFAAFDPDHIQLQGGVDQRYGGWGQTPGKYSMVFEDTGVQTNMHELGHNLGLKHSDLFNPVSGSIQRYGDVTCVMGDGEPSRGVNAVKLSQLGMGTAASVRTLGDAATSFLLVPADRPSEDVGLPENVYRWAEYPLDDRGNSLILSNRNRRHGPLKTLEVHHKRRGDSSLFLGKLRLDEEASFLGSPTFKVTGVYPQYGVIEVQVNGGDSKGVPALPHFPDGSLPPAEGFFWREDMHGHGVLYKNGRIYIWTFDSNGSAIFLWGIDESEQQRIALFDHTDKMRGTCTFSEMGEGDHVLCWVIDGVPGSAVLNRPVPHEVGDVVRERNRLKTTLQLPLGVTPIPIELDFVPAVKVGSAVTQPSYYTIRVNNAKHATKMSGGYTFALITDKEEVYDE